MRAEAGPLAALVGLAFEDESVGGGLESVAARLTRSEPVTCDEARDVDGQGREELVAVHRWVASLGDERVDDGVPAFRVLDEAVVTNSSSDTPRISLARSSWARSFESFVTMRLAPAANAATRT